MNHIRFASWLTALAILAVAAACSKSSSPPPNLRLPVKKDYQWSKEGNLLKVIVSYKDKLDSSSLWRFTTYEYDAAYNIVRTIDSMQVVTPDGDIIDSIKGVKVREVNYEYSNGRLVQTSSSDGSPATTVFSYDPQGRLIKTDNAYYYDTLIYSGTGDTISRTTRTQYNHIRTGLTIYYFQNNNIQKQELYYITDYGLGAVLSLTQGNYLYDKNHTPFNIAPQNRFVSPYMGGSNFAPASENNLLNKQINVYSPSAISVNYTYQYNASGYPYWANRRDSANGQPAGIGSIDRFYYTNR